MTVFPSDPIETFSHFFSELFSAATLKAKRDNYSAKQKNQLLKISPLELYSPTPASSVHLKIKMAAINGKTRYISTISPKNRGL